MADVTISRTIPDAKVEYASTGFLEEHPLPTDEDGNPTCTVKEHFTNIIFGYGEGEIEAGWDKIRKREAEDEGNVFV